MTCRWVMAAMTRARPPAFAPQHRFRRCDQTREACTNDENVGLLSHETELDLAVLHQPKRAPGNEAALLLSFFCVLTAGIKRCG